MKRKMKKKFIYILFLLVLIIQGCCMGESTLSHNGQTTIIQNIITLNPDNKIYKISYPNSLLELTPNSYQSIIYLSEASDNTKIFIHSTSGFDTVVVYCEKTINYSPGDACDDEYLAKKVFDPKVISHTFDSCYFITTIKDSYPQEKIDNLYIK
jgi:hypothetical protein